MAKYDVRFDLKVSLAADRLVREFGLEYEDSQQIARLVLLIAREVEERE